MDFPDLNLNFDLLEETLIGDTIDNNIIYKNVTKRRQLLNIKKKEILKDIIIKLPSENEYYHIVSKGTYDFYTMIPLFIEIGGPIQEFFGSTWTMNRANVQDLLQRFDNKEILNITVLTGLYFKRRETAVYATLLEGLSQRKQRYFASKNHSKIILIKQKDNYYVVEGSANFTANPRIEQYVMTNNYELYQFHRSWMEALIGKGK